MYQDFMSEVLVLIRLCKFLFKMKLEQPENLQGGVIEGPFLATFAHIRQPIYQMNAQSWVKSQMSTFNFLARPKK